MNQHICLPAIAVALGFDFLETAFLPKGGIGAGSGLGFVVAR
jgi:hypothetical protein